MDRREVAGSYAGNAGAGSDRYFERVGTDASAETISAHTTSIEKFVTPGKG